jgi:hypothetical protein
MLNRVTLDGFFAGPNGEIDWFIPDSEIDKKLIEEGKAGTPDTFFLDEQPMKCLKATGQKWPKGQQT